MCACATRMMRVKAKRDARVETFRRLALELPGAEESSHMGSPDFRLNNQIFATLAAQDRGLGMVKLMPEQQAAFVAEQPKVYLPVPGGWGRGGATHIDLHAASDDQIAGALMTAYRNLEKKQAAKKAPVRVSKTKRPPQ